MCSSTLENTDDPHDNNTSDEMDCPNQSSDSDSSDDDDDNIGGIDEVTFNLLSDYSDSDNEET